MNDKLVVAVATTGREPILSAVLPLLGAQTRRPDALVVAACEPSDVDRAVLAALPFPAEVSFGPKGLCAQRNRALAAAGDAGLVVFLDDDFLPAPDYLAAAGAIAAAHPDVAMMTGTVIADGILGPGLTVADGLARLAADPGGDAALADTYGAYGCNMVLRLPLARRHGVAFDERLPLYGWLEDTDFSRRMARHGRIVRAAALRGVHLGTKGGRAAGVKLGYSQIANPVYLVRKRSLVPAFAAKHMARNLAANLVKTLRPEPWVDRPGRLRGNFLALRDAFTGRLRPENMIGAGR